MNDPAVSLTRSALLALRTRTRAQLESWYSAMQSESGLAKEVIAKNVAEFGGLPYVDAATLNRRSPGLDLVRYVEARRRSVLVTRDAGRVHLALPDPFDDRMFTWASRALPADVVYECAHPEDIHACLLRLEADQKALTLAAGGDDAGDRSVDTSEELTLERIDEDDNPVVRLVNSTLYDALQAGASDVHFETAQDRLVIRYRLDGVLNEIASTGSVETAEQSLSRIKVMADLDIAERRIPQDGRFRVRVQGRDVDFRVSIMPSLFGEDAVLRILDRRHLADQFAGLRLENLGFDDDSIAQLRRFSREPYGMVLVTGPTGSGKTTTLYAALSEINSGEDKIVTIEDPIEYHLPGVLQIPVNEKKGLTFARGLRSILRHDPDKILVGEIRDGETAQIAIQSALTGHLVFTTVHANNVFDVIGRFIHMDVDPYNFIAAVNAIFSQRLVRTLCAHCAKAAEHSPSVLNASGIDPSCIGEYRLMDACGCAHCRGVGYRGRRAIAEVLHLTDEIRELIIHRAPMGEIRSAAARQGTRVLREQALELVRRGITSLAEADRVTFVA